MPVAVLIPYQPGCPHRARALEHTRSVHRDQQMVIGRDGAGPWVKAHAVTAAAAQTTADVLVITDADVTCDRLPGAVAAVSAGAAWAVPHRYVHRLTLDATTRVLAGAPANLDAVLERPNLGVEGGGIVVIRRDVWDACPLDPRFRGWGSEDESWGFALRTMFGPPHRPTGHAPLVHLFHPPQARATRSFGSVEGRDLRKRYARARGNPAVMTALIEEAKAHDAHRAAQPARHADRTRGVGR